MKATTPPPIAETPSTKCRTGPTADATGKGFECMGGARNPVDRLGQGRRAQNSSPNPTTTNPRELVDQLGQRVKKSGRPLTLPDGRDTITAAVETRPPILAPLLTALTLAATWRAVGYFDIPNPVGIALIVATGVCGLLLVVAETMQAVTDRKRPRHTAFSSVSNVGLDAIDSSEVAA